MLKTKFDTLKATVNNIEKKVPDATTLIHINEYNTDKQNLEKKIGDVDKKYQIQVKKYQKYQWSWEQNTKY